MQPLQLQLGRGQLLQRIVVQIPGDLLACLVDGGGDVPEQHLPCRIDLLEPLHRPLQVRLGVLQLPDQPRGQACVLQHPSVLTRESFCPPRAVCRNQAEPLVTRSPRHRDRVVHLEHVEHVAEVAHILASVRPEHQVVVHHPTCEIVPVGGAGSGVKTREELVLDAVCAADGAQQPLVGQLPEKDLVGRDQLRDAAGEPAVEVGQSVPGPGMARHRQQGVDGRLVRLLDPLGASRLLLVYQPLLLAPVQVGAQVDERVDHLPAALVELGQANRGRDLMREDRKGALLGRSVACGARHADHA